jgi:dienelactone hydrolase
MVAANVSQLFDRDPNPFLVAALLTPAAGKATVGVIVMGMGIADMQAVRRFAKLGLLAMQIRLIKDTAHHRDEPRRFATYDTSGVSRCQAAMDFLTSKHGVQRFILMGNCALANIAFNCARRDARVAGVILTNPHIPKSLTSTLRFKIERHLFRWKSWGRLLTGKMHMPRAAALRAKNDNPNSSVPQEARYTQDLVLPADFPQQLKNLIEERGLRTLLVLAEHDLSRFYFRRHYHKALRQLAQGVGLRYEIAPTDVHDFSHEDAAALVLNAIVADWTVKNWT